MAQKAQHIFTGLDTDTADRFLKEGSFRDSLNIHIGSSEGDGMFSVENVKGNTLVTYTLPAGTNQVIGAHEDITNKCIYFFLCNSSTLNIQSTNVNTVVTTTPHGLVNTDLIAISGVSGRSDIIGDWIDLDPFPINSTTFKVSDPPTYLYSHHTSAANLSGTSGVSGIVTKYAHSILKYNAITNTISLVYKHSRLNFNKNFPITGTALLNNVLHWTDNYNPPRSLLLDSTFLTPISTFFDESAIDFIKLPPTIPVTVTGKWVNSVGTVIPYVTPNAEPNSMNDKSYQFIYRYVYNDNTRSVWSPVSETVATGFNDSKINKIELTFRLPVGFTTLITSIEIAFRDDILGNFKYIDRITSGQSDPATYNFFNNIAYSIVDSAETSKPFDSVPNITGALTSVQNRVFIGDCTEGFDVNPNDFSAINVIPEGNANAKDVIAWKAGETYDIGIVFFDRAERKSGVYKLFRITIPLTASSATSPTFSMQGQPPLWATHYRIVSSTVLSKSFFVQGYYLIQEINIKNNTTSILFNSINGDVSYNPVPGDILDTGYKKYPVKGIGVDSFGNSLIIVTGTMSEEPSSLILLQFAKCEIYTSATSISQLYYETPFTFSILNPGTLQRAFIGTEGIGTQIRLRRFVSGDTYVRNLNDALVYHSRAVMQVETIFLYTGTDINFRINGILFSVPKAGSTELSAAQSLIDQINATPNMAAFMLGYGNPFAGVARNIARFVVYDKRKGILGNIIATEAFTVVPVNRKAGISNIGQISGASAQNFIDNNFIYAMTSNDTNTDNSLVWQKNIGRPNIILVDGDKQIRRSTLIRFGGRFLTGTRINFLNSFDSLDQEQLTNFGTIRKLINASNNAAEGTILLAVQENEISSCYIGQAVITNANGTNQLVSTDKVIGTVNPLQKLVGTVNPESVVQYNGLVYGFDALKGVVWRYGQNGLDFISDNGMRRFFYERSQYLLSLGSFRCYGGIDPYHNEYIISIPNTDTEKITIAWSETLNRWTSFMSYLPEWYQKVNTHLVSFINGQTWLHRSNTLSNNYYGVQYKSKLRMICNKEPDITKILQIVEQKSTSQWDCTEIATPEGQNSELLGLFDIATPNSYPQDFRKYDNTTYVGPVLRDKNTPNFQTSDYPLLKGDVIRSDIFSIKMENAKTTKENLYFVNLMYIPSYKKA